MDDINVLKLPQSTIVNRVIPKEKLYSHGDVNYTTKRKFVDQIDKIVWSNKIATQTLNISSGKYEEIEVLQVYLKNGQIDNKLLTTIIDKFKGGPVGLTTIATALGEDPGTLEEVYEPFLIKEGFLKRTPRGREVTELAYTHLGRKRISSDQGFLFD